MPAPNCAIATHPRLRRHADPEDRCPPASLEAIAADLPGLTGFARGLTGDLDAVTAGLALRCGSGGTEGAVNRIKMFNRHLFVQPSSVYSGR